MPAVEWRVQLRNEALVSSLFLSYLLQGNEYGHLSYLRFVIYSALVICGAWFKFHGTCIFYPSVIFYHLFIQLKQLEFIYTGQRHSCTLKVMPIFRITNAGINAQLILIVYCFVITVISHLNNISASSVSTKNCFFFYIATNRRKNKLFVYIRSQDFWCPSDSSKMDGIGILRKQGEVLSIVAQAYNISVWR